MFISIGVKTKKCFDQQLVSSTPKEVSSKECFHRSRAGRVKHYAKGLRRNITFDKFRKLLIDTPSFIEKGKQKAKGKKGFRRNITSEETHKAFIEMQNLIDDIMSNISESVSSIKEVIDGKGLSMNIHEPSRKKGSHRKNDFDETGEGPIEKEIYRGKNDFDESCRWLLDMGYSPKE